MFFVTQRKISPDTVNTCNISPSVLEQNAMRNPCSSLSEVAVHTLIAYNTTLMRTAAMRRTVCKIIQPSFACSIIRVSFHIQWCYVYLAGSALMGWMRLTHQDIRALFCPLTPP